MRKNIPLQGNENVFLTFIKKDWGLYNKIDNDDELTDSQETVLFDIEILKRVRCGVTQSITQNSHKQI